MIDPMTRRLGLLILGVALTSASGCVHTKAPPSRPVEAVASDAPFVGRIREIRGSLVVLDEEGTNLVRRAEILVSPNTEILTRGGMIMPPGNLRVRMRLTIWFRGPVNQAGSVLSASAERAIVDY